jgi:hypothetical protein
MRPAACAPTVEPKQRLADDGRSEMPRYLIERTFANGLSIPAGAAGEDRCLAVIERNADDGVTWLHSYVSDDRQRTFCVYDAPSPEAIRKTARRNDLPVDRITQVRVLDPYFLRMREEP